MPSNSRSGRAGPTLGGSRLSESLTRNYASFWRMWLIRGNTERGRARNATPAASRPNCRRPAAGSYPAAGVVNSGQRFLRILFLARVGNVDAAPRDGGNAGSFGLHLDG